MISIARRMRAALATLAFPLLLAPAVARGADGSDLVITAKTGREQYPSGETVDITVSLCNPTAEPITVTYACPCCYFELFVLDSTGEPVSQFTWGCIQIVYGVTWEPGECIDESYEWEQLAPSFDSGEPVGPGDYSVLYRWDPGAFFSAAQSPSFRVGDLVAVPALSGVGAVVLAALLGTLAIRRLSRRRGSGS